MGEYNATLGPLLLGTWLNTALFTIELWQMSLYFKKRGSKDHLVIRLTMFSALVLDIATTATIYIAVYMYLITHFGDVPFAARTTWGLSVLPTMTGFSAALTQNFLIWRVFKLMRNYYICVFLSLCSLVALGSSVAVCITSFTATSLTSRTKLRTIAITWFTADCVTNVLLSAILVWFLLSIKTSFGNTHGLLRRLSRAAIETGIAPSATALLGLIAYFAAPTTNIVDIFLLVLGRVYTFTLLYNLNLRGALMSGDTPSNNKGWSWNSPQTDIRVSREAVTHIHPPEIPMDGLEFQSTKAPTRMAGIPEFHVDLENASHLNTSQAASFDDSNKSIVGGHTS